VAIELYGRSGGIKISALKSQGIPYARGIFLEYL